MKRITILFYVFFMVSVFAEEAPKEINLPAPLFKNDVSLMNALKNRMSNRAFKDSELSLQDLSNILFAGYGINRLESGKRTAPSAFNLQYVDIYVALKDGFYLYDAKENKLVLILNEDIREMTGLQDFVKDAPLNLVYIGDYKKFNGKMEEKDYDFYYGLLAGSICQNVYLYCSSEKLSTVARGSVPRDELGEKINLLPNQKILIAQTVGYPAE